ncbi:hypothetical protein CF641_37975, partial [Burkholderia pseudomallei]
MVLDASAARRTCQGRTACGASAAHTFAQWIHARAPVPGQHAPAGTAPLGPRAPPGQAAAPQPSATGTMPRAMPSRPTASRVQPASLRHRFHNPQPHPALLADGHPRASSDSDDRRLAKRRRLASRSRRAPRRPASPGHIHSRHAMPSRGPGVGPGTATAHAHTP